MEHSADPPVLRPLDARVPRYTSYPPANHFAPSIGPARHAEWLRGVDPETAASLYVHIPFCRRLCLFCACRTQGTQTAGPIDRYLDHLEREIALVAAELPDKPLVSHLHLGGGTPTILTPAQTARLSRMLRDSFRIADGAEISVEIDPTEISGARLDALAEFGLTRCSIGIQDFDPAVQEAIGRPQSVEQTRAAVDGLRERGVSSLNVDLVYGLPRQTEASLRLTLAEIEALAPERIAVFGYAHVPSMAKRQRLIPVESLPDGPQRQRLFALARRLLTWQGYRQIGIDHFAMPEDTLAKAADDGTLHRNFQGYTTDAARTLIGLGASALSRFPEGHAQNMAGTAAWQRQIEAGYLATARGHALSDEDRIRGAVIERILCDFSADLAALAGHDPALLQRLRANAATLAQQLGDVVSFSGDRIELTDRTGVYARIAASAFDAYFDPLQASGSLAV